jgi:hypothetical protein
VSNFTTYKQNVKGTKDQPVAFGDFPTKGILQINSSAPGTTFPAVVINNTTRNSSTGNGQSQGQHFARLGWEIDFRVLDWEHRWSKHRGGDWRINRWCSRHVRGDDMRKVPASLKGKVNFRSRPMMRKGKGEVIEERLVRNGSGLLGGRLGGLLGDHTTSSIEVGAEMNREMDSGNTMVERVHGVVTGTSTLEVETRTATPPTAPLDGDVRV